MRKCLVSKEPRSSNAETVLWNELHAIDGAFRHSEKTWKHRGTEDTEEGLIHHLCGLCASVFQTSVFRHSSC